MIFLKGTVLNDSNYLHSSDEWNLIDDLDKKSFISIKLLVKVIIACGYAFGLGYSLFYLDNPIKTGFLFLGLLAVSYLILIIPHEFLHVLFYPNKKNVIIRYTLSKLKFVSYINGTISKSLMLLSLILPFIIFSIIPSIIIYLFDFNLFLYAFASANAIMSGRDIFNFIFIIKSTPKKEYLKIDQYGIYLKAKSINSSNNTIEELESSK